MLNGVENNESIFEKQKILKYIIVLDTFKIYSTNSNAKFVFLDLEIK